MIPSRGLFGDSAHSSAALEDAGEDVAIDGVTIPRGEMVVVVMRSVMAM